MSTIEQLNSFTAFVRQKIAEGIDCETLDELYQEWRLGHLSPGELADVRQALDESDEDIKAGRLRSHDIVLAEFRSKYAAQ